MISPEQYARIDATSIYVAQGAKRPFTCAICECPMEVGDWYVLLRVDGFTHRVQARCAVNIGLSVMYA